MIYFIDFDGTICPHSGGKPQKECISVLKKLKENNHTIIIYSCRANHDCVDDSSMAIKEMTDYLDDNDIPYDKIAYNKPYFNFCIDDRNIGTPLTSDHSVDWSKIDKLLF